MNGNGPNGLNLAGGRPLCCGGVAGGPVRRLLARAGLFPALPHVSPRPSLNAAGGAGPSEADLEQRLRALQQGPEGAVSD